MVFEKAPLWEFEGGLRTTHEFWRTYSPKPRGEHPYIIPDSIDNESSTAKYYQWWGDTAFCKIAEEEGAFFIPDSVLDCIEEGEESCPGADQGLTTTLHPDLECDDNLHPNSIGYGVLAERIAEYLVGWGLGEYAVDLGKLSRNLLTNLSDAEAAIGALEARNHTAPAEVTDAWEMAEYLHGKGFPYIANRTLVSGALSPALSILEHWDEIKDVFAQASECIDALEQEGRSRDAAISKGDLARAQAEWEEWDCERTCADLAKVVGRCPEHVLPSVLGLLLLPILLQRAREA